MLFILFASFPPILFRMETKRSSLSPRRSFALMETSMVPVPPPAKFISSSICQISVGFASMLWQVPVTIATSRNPAALTFVLDKASMTVSVEGVEPEEWILVSVTHGKCRQCCTVHIWTFAVYKQGCRKTVKGEGGSDVCDYRGDSWQSPKRVWGMLPQKILEF